MRVKANKWLQSAYRLRAPLAVSCATFIALALVSPTLEIYRLLALDADMQAGVIIVTGLALLLLMTGLGAICTALRKHDPSDATDYTISAICTMLPAIGLAFGLYNAGVEAQPIGVGQPAGVIDVGVVEALTQINALPNTLKTASLVTMLCGIAVVILAYRCGFGSQYSTRYLRLRWVASAIAIVAILMWITFTLEPVRVPRALGSVSIFLLFMLCAAALASVLFKIREVWKIPAFSCLLVLALLLSWLNISDNYVPLIESRTSGSRPVIPTVVAFNEWLKSRGDRDTFAERNQPYPVFIISAEGGGHYAAHLAATFLARAQDRCPNFSQHIFAISSVSGGSIGAGVFGSLSKTFAENGPWVGCKVGDIGVGLFEARAKAILSNDFLSPVVAATLFGDVPYAFIPFLRNQDRGRTFDLALEQAWDNVLPNLKNPLAKPYLDFWDPKGAAPAILANTTQVENGMRVVVGPFMSIDGPQQAGTLHQRSRRTIYYGKELVDEGWEALASNEDIRLSTAIGISARFPWIMPAARFKTSKTQFRLVDGGYLDNSGDETAFDLIMELGQLDTMRGKLADGSIVPSYQLHLISLTSDTALTPGAVEGFGDLLSPIRTMLSSRPTRSQMAKHRIRAFINRAPGMVSGTSGEFSSPTPMVQLNHEEFKVPLTWQLSEASRRLIALQSGEAHRCGYSSGVFEIVQPTNDTSNTQSRAFAHINNLVRSNNCIACSITYRLMGRQPMTERACASP